MYTPANRTQQPHALEPRKQTTLNDYLEKARKSLVTHYKQDKRHYVCRCQWYPDIQQGVGDSEASARDHFLDNLRQAIVRDSEDPETLVLHRGKGRPKGSKQRLQVYLDAQKLSYFKSTAERLCLQPAEMVELMFTVFQNVQNTAQFAAIDLEKKGIAAANKQERGERLTNDEHNSLARFHRGDAIWENTSYSMGKPIGD